MSSRKSVVIRRLPSNKIVEHGMTLSELHRWYPFSVDPLEGKNSSGLSSLQVEDSKQKWGSNKIPVPKRQPWFLTYFKLMSNLFTFVLFICGLLSIVIFIINTTYWISLYTGLLFWVVAAFNAALEFWQKYSSEKTLEGFMTLIPSNALARRNNCWIEISVVDLVVGDVVKIRSGNKVPADLRILWSENLRLDNSSLTGESEPQERSSVTSGSDVPPLHAPCLAFSGNLVVSGEAICLVIKVGLETVIGKLANFAVSEAKLTSQLDLEMRVFFRRLVLVATCMALLALILGFSMGLVVEDVFSAAIGIAVSFLPQGLPATMTILLTKAARRMAARQVLVKELRAIETLGSMTILSTDKTGTLTMNEMSLCGAWINGTIYNSTDKMEDNLDSIKDELVMVTLCTSCTFRTLDNNNNNSFEPVDTHCDPKKNVGLERNELILNVQDDNAHGNSQSIQGICESVTSQLDSERGETVNYNLNERNNSDNNDQHNLPSISYSETLPDIADEIIGDATEVGILKFTSTVFDVKKVMAQHERLSEIPFNSMTKTHTVLVQMNGKKVVIVKGAPERVWERCERYGMGRVLVRDRDGEEFNRVYEYFASKGLRIIALATKTISASDMNFDLENKVANGSGNALTSRLEDLARSGLTFHGLFCLRDPPKDGVRWAVERLKASGVQVMMVTGDHPLTAEAISRQVGILTESDCFRRPPSATDVIARPKCRAAVIHGDAIDAMTQEDWVRLTALDEVIFSRTSPSSKLEVVTQFQRAGHIVGFCGDGVNDSPALRKANLGISMNFTASDVSKDAASIILLDDRFVSIVAGVFEGRLIFENVKKSIRYTVTHIMPEVSALLLYTLLLLPPPLSPIIMLMIDVFAELGPAVSFAAEPAEYDLMSLPSRHRVANPPIRRLAVRQRLNSWRFVPSALVKSIIFVDAIFYLPNVGEALVDWDLVCWAFFEGGVINAMGAWGAFCLVIAVEGVPFDTLYRASLTYFNSNSPPLTLTNGSTASSDQQLIILGRIQAAYFVAIILCQLFNLFIQKHRWRPPYGWDMMVNWYTYVGIFFALLIVAIVAYIPGLNYIFDTYIPPAIALAPPAAAGLFLFLYELIRRWLRTRGYFGGIPNKFVLHPPQSRKCAEVPSSDLRRSRQYSIVLLNDQ